jgi:hypothetical protein
MKIKYWVIVVSLCLQGCTYEAYNAVKPEPKAPDFVGSYIQFRILSALVSRATEAIIPVVVLKTGQTTSYATGDDGNFQIGTARSYTDNSDGTIKDNATGLTWQKCSRGLSGATCASGSATTVDWTTANSYCSSLSLASKTWRLPTIQELGNLSDFGQSSQFINVTFFPNTIASYYISNNNFLINSTYLVWNVNYSDGSIDISYRDVSNYSVRCVSGK